MYLNELAITYNIGPYQKKVFRQMQIITTKWFRVSLISCLIIVLPAPVYNTYFNKFNIKFHSALLLTTDIATHGRRNRGSRPPIFFLGGGPSYRWTPNNSLNEWHNTYVSYNSLKSLHSTYYEFIVHYKFS